MPSLTSSRHTNLCRTGKYLLTASLAVLLVPVALAVEAKPDRIEIKSFEDAVTLSVTHDGNPIPAADIKSVKLYVDDHDYDHMIVTEKSDGSVTVRPSEALELGRYDLAINTSHGEVRVPVTALQGIADAGLEARAMRQGVGVDEVRTQLGISQSVGQERIDLGFPSVYYVGQKLSQNLKVAAPRTATWMVNGERLKTTGGTLDYVLEQPGVYDIAYVEKEGDRTVAVGLGTVTATAEPVVRILAAPGVKQTLIAPRDYGRISWKLDGVDAGSGSSWTGIFDSAGEHTVTVRAEAPEPGATAAFREVRYVITVP